VHAYLRIVATRCIAGERPRGSRCDDTWKSRDDAGNGLFHVKPVTHRKSVAAIAQVAAVANEGAVVRRMRRRKSSRFT